MQPPIVDDWYGKKWEKERLHDAARSGGLEETRALLDEGLPIDAFDDLGHSPLHCAAIGGHIEAVRYLIKAGANVNSHDEEKIGETPLGTVAAKLFLRYGEGAGRRWCRSDDHGLRVQYGSRQKCCTKEGGRQKSA